MSKKLMMLGVDPEPLPGPMRSHGLVVCEGSGTLNFSLQDGISGSTVETWTISLPFDHERNGTSEIDSPRIAMANDGKLILVSNVHVYVYDQIGSEGTLIDDFVIPSEIGDTGANGVDVHQVSGNLILADADSESLVECSGISNTTLATHSTPAIVLGSVALEPNTNQVVVNAVALSEWYVMDSLGGSQQDSFFIEVTAGGDTYTVNNQAATIDAETGNLIIGVGSGSYSADMSDHHIIVLDGLSNTIIDHFAMSGTSPNVSGVTVYEPPY